MKKLGMLVLIAVALVGTYSCNTTKNKTNVESSNELTVTGTVGTITNGKDGYTAAIKDKNNKTYLATISMVNLMESKSEYKRYEQGDKITVTGPTWKDDEGNVYITVKELKEVKK
ncbi:hypothetical protein H1R17_01745 [Flavobacterium sp. xlx-214]|uniref:hypothetical protein n=1 Tax=unclassified Flavobacterium TaxID=196869 RepID=UPI0013D454F8|nr:MULTISPECIES: hypothetical protein [unclassified Flavobacterium]MBA5792745.1 hypothetical protein [Flavobacterium sp. xlx-221]QMI83882.1 hypothetical protein H1R17_01745 [Flavobacterium sp. xlx-214]